VEQRGIRTRAQDKKAQLNFRVRVLTYVPIWLISVSLPLAGQTLKAQFLSATGAGAAAGARPSVRACILRCADPTVRSIEVW